MWIKVRASLRSDPKLIRMARAVADDPEFREWMTPGCRSPLAEVVSDAALRAACHCCVTQVWASAREHGTFDDDDLVMEGLCIDDLDALAGAPGIGRAMEVVGWAEYDGRRKCVILPGFRKFNVPKTAAERMADMRQRRSWERDAVVTKSASRKRNARPGEETNRRTTALQSSSTSGAREAPAALAPRAPRARARAGPAPSEPGACASCGREVVLTLDVEPVPSFCARHPEVAIAGRVHLECSVKKRKTCRAWRTPSKPFERDCSRCTAEKLATKMHANGRAGDDP